jgi:hypothetical protein
MSGSVFVYSSSVLFFAGAGVAAIKFAGRMFRESSDLDDQPSMDRAVEVAASRSFAPPHGGPHELAVGALPHAGQIAGPPVVLHCPKCGAPLLAQSVPYGANCDACHCHVTVRADGAGRLSIVVVERDAK